MKFHDVNFDKLRLFPTYFIVLDFAIREFREMKMQPSLERALRRKDILKA